MPKGHSTRTVMVPITIHIDRLLRRIGYLTVVERERPLNESERRELDNSIHWYDNYRRYERAGVTHI